MEGEPWKIFSSANRPNLEEFDLTSKDLGYDEKKLLSDLIM